MPAAIAIPLITSAIAGGSSIAASAISKHGSNQTPLLPAGLDHNALLSSINTQKGLADIFQHQGADFLGQGHDVLNQPLHFLQNILGGDRTALMESLAPEIAAINAQFKAPLNMAGITGRGSSLQPDLEAGRQSAISNLFFQQRPAAADKLTGIAQGLMNLGLGSQQAGAGVTGDVSKELLDYNGIIRGIQAQQSSQSAGAMGALGSSLGPLLKQVLTGVLNKGGPAAPPVPPIDWHLPDTDNVQMPGANGFNIDPAVISSLINFGQDSPNIYSSWLPHDSPPPR
jgi:hypothetical protein